MPHKRYLFLVLSPFRAVLCTILVGFIVFWALMGQTLFYFYIGSGNNFVYKSGTLAVHFVDVGHGNCTILQLPDGKVAIIDGGSDFYKHRVRNYIQTRIRPRRNHIDYIINTHPHVDHLEGLLFIKKHFSYGKFLTTEDNPGGKYKRHQKITEGLTIRGKDYRIRFHAVESPLVDLVEVNDYEVENQVCNEMSPIITIEYFKQVFVITGDAGHSTERQFIEDTPDATRIFGEWVAETPKAPRRADDLTVYLQVGHHGSRNSTMTYFLDFLRPDVAIIPVGYASEILYGHPHPTVTDNLKEEGIKTYLTREAGHVVFRCDGNNVKKFLGFSNPPDLTFLWIVVTIAIIVVCFLNYTPSRLRP